MGVSLELTLPDFFPQQIEFLNSKSRHTGYGGARGGGKSFVARWCAVLLALKYAGVQILLTRRTYPELRENHIVPLQKILKCQEDNTIANFKAADKVFVFPNGSRIVCGYCANELDVLQFQGQSYDVIFVEEATLFTEFQITCLIECNRPSGLTKNPFKPMMKYTMNPGGASHQYFKRLFIDKQYQRSEKPEDYTMIRSKVYDNTFIMQNDPDYVRMLENLPEDRRKAMLDGDWDAFEGQFFTEFNRDVHVIKPFVIPKEWRIYRSRDYGLDMLSCHWYAMDFSGNVYVYKEIYQSGLIVSEAGELINNNTTEKIYMDICPPDLYNKNSQTGKSAADIFWEKCGHNLTKASNDRVNGWLAVKEFLRLQKDEQGKVHPKLFIFENCTNLIRCIPQAVYDTKKTNDICNEPHEITHSLDDLRYFCISWTRTPVVPKPTISYEENPLDGYKTIQQEEEDGGYYEGVF